MGDEITYSEYTKILLAVVGVTIRRIVNRRDNRYPRKSLPVRVMHPDSLLSL